MEILFVVAIIGLFTGILSIGVNALLDTDGTNPKKILETSIAEARRAALHKHSSVFLAFDPETRTLNATLANGQAAATSAPLPENTRIDFLGQAADTAKILLAGQAVETTTIPRATFYNDGTCSPFRAQIVNDMGVMLTVEIDPWTCAPVLQKQNTP